MKRLTIFICLAVLLLGGGLFVPNQEATAQGMVPRLYLPIIKQERLLQNGGFEAGPAYWTDNSSSGIPQITNATEERQADTEGEKPPPAHSGDWLAWMGGFNNEIGTLSQSVFISSRQPYLTFWQIVSSLEGVCNNYDQARILVNSSVRYTFTLCNQRTNLDWQQISVDLYAYRNQSVTIEFQIDTDSSNVSSLILDDISFGSYRVGGNWTPVP